VRIIGGSLRSRRVRFAALPGLRPTPDRMRETLFNWLSPYLPGAHCLDLFAGTGVLGFEAMSRGAASVTFVESNRQAQFSIAHNIESLNLVCGLEKQSAWHYLEGLEQAFDLIFIDPPYDLGYSNRALDLILKTGILKSDGLIYLEHRRSDTESLPGPAWQILRTSQCGDVSGHLICRNPGDNESRENGSE